jgi:galactokinase
VPVPDQVRAFAPGRVNLIGEHTDYNEGLALPFTIQLGVTVTARRLSGRTIEAAALDLGETDSFDVGDRERGDGWRTFVRGAVGELVAGGVELSGARLEFGGDIPQGAGLSSSAALEVGLTLALLGLADAPPPDRTELAKLCARIENDWVGAQTGLLDQLACLYGEPHHALRIDFRSLEITPVPLELGDHRLITLDSGSPHVIASSGYNDRRAECGRAAELLGLTSLSDATLEMAETLPAPLNRRARHIVTSNGRVEAAVAALERHDFDELGRLLDSSHRSLRDDYEVSTPEVEAAVERVKAAGALGVRLIGGGFGGHVLGLMPPGAADPEGALEVRPGPGASLVG